MLILVQAPAPSRLAFDTLPAAKSLREEMSELVEFLQDTDAARPLKSHTRASDSHPPPPPLTPDKASAPRAGPASAPLAALPRAGPAFGPAPPSPRPSQPSAGPGHPSPVDHAPNPSNQACPTSYAPLRAARGEEDQGTERMADSDIDDDDEARA